ncbi:hypothetical protein [Pararhodonellum marinum]|uniref:hypothetical protein n=1 Tax=Pararhodonellum marinum TaxID=2755358 RepID=UPI00188EDF67|nr:hypothetical protein [Pararhodonellum marinum]
MKKINYLLAIALLFLYACDQEEAVPSFGEGDGKLGIGFVISSSDNPNARVMQDYLVIESGFIQIEELELELEGRNDMGKFEKEIEIKFSEIKKIEFDKFDASVDFFINIPEGEYKEIELEMDLIDYKNEPSIYLSGTFNDSENNSIPVVFEYFDDEIEFEVEIEPEDDDEYFRVDRIENPLVLFELNPSKWFNGVSEEDLEKAERIEGVIVLNKNTNRRLFDKVAKRIKEAAEIEIEIK